MTILFSSSLGFIKELKEISKSKGILYEPNVVDACVHLFESKRFHFE